MTSDETHLPICVCLCIPFPYWIWACNVNCLKQHNTIDMVLYQFSAKALEGLCSFHSHSLEIKALVCEDVHLAYWMGGHVVPQSIANAQTCEWISWNSQPQLSHQMIPTYEWSQVITSKTIQMTNLQ
jgi:hypothetical protein